MTNPYLGFYRMGSGVLDQFDIPAPFANRWDGHMHTATKIVSAVPNPATPSAKSGT